MANTCLHITAAVADIGPANSATIKAYCREKWGDNEGSILPSDHCPQQYHQHDCGLLQLENGVYRLSTAEEQQASVGVHVRGSRSGARSSRGAVVITAKPTAIATFKRAVLVAELGEIIAALPDGAVKTAASGFSLNTASETELCELRELLADAKPRK